jgi:hypothetical protein
MASCLLAAATAAAQPAAAPKASAGPAAPAGPTVAPAVAVRADPPIVVQAKGGARVKLHAEALGFTPESVTWSQVPDRINPLRTKGKARIDGKGADVSASLPEPGVYQFVALARGDEATARGTTWVQVWESRGPLEAGPALGTFPGVKPPPSVRQFGPPPPPFEHPRVLFTDADWPEMSERARTGKVAGWGVKTIRQWVAETLDDPKTPTGRLADELHAWLEQGGKGTGPDLAALGGDAVLSSEARGVFSSMLLDAAFLLWLDNDPRKPAAKQPAAARERGRRLARIAAAAATLHFRAIWDRDAKRARVTEGPLAVRGLAERGEPVAGPALCDLALAYDLLHDWMEEPERLAVRDFLVATGYGRHTSAPGFTRPRADAVAPGHMHNGDFGNMNDQQILVALAVEGEEGRASPDVRAAFCTPDPKARSARWMKPLKAGDSAGWPTAMVASVENLERQIRWLTDWFVTPWGTAANHTAYLGLSAKHMLPATVALARRGENLFVTTHLYQLALHPLRVVHPAEGPIVSRHGLGQTHLGWWDHHDGTSFQQRGTMAIVWKYMYPDDPLIDYVWRAYLPTLDRDPLVAALFGIDPTPDSAGESLERMTAAKGIPLTHFDPQRGIVTMRSAWTDDSLALWFDCCGSDAYQGHMHAERNSFALFALGRAWSIAPGYHVTISDAQAAVLVKDPRHADDPASGGYLGESPSSATNRPPLPGHFPTPPGKMLEVREADDHAWTLVAGDATACYTFGYSGKRELDTGLPLKSFLYPGMEELFVARSPDYAKLFGETLKVSQTDYNPMRHAIRTMLFVRGTRPYVLVVDDYDKDGRPHDWRWSMNCAQGFAPGLDTRFVDAGGKGVYSSLAIDPGATATEAVLLHSPIDDGKEPGQAGLPRLLVRDLGPGAAAPPIMLESRPPGGPGPHLTYGYDNNRQEKVATPVPTNRVLIERRDVVRPDYTVLLFPFRTGEALPATSWNANRTELTIDKGPAGTDTIRFERGAKDNRTRLRVERGRSQR